MQTITLREEAARLKRVLRETAQAVTVSKPATAIAYASLGLRYPGDAPKTPADLAACIRIMARHPWMIEPAFAYLAGQHDTAWPYLIPHWKELMQTVSAEVDIASGVDAYSPRTFEILRKLHARRCTKPHCNHPLESHTGHHSNQPGRCTVDGCKCGFFLKGEF
jgi:hypothetical protein